MASSDLLGLGALHVLSEVSMIADVNRRQRRRSALVSRLSRADALRASRMIASYPDLPPRLIATFVKRGLSADDAPVRRAAWLQGQADVIPAFQRRQGPDRVYVGGEWLSRDEYDQLERLQRKSQSTQGYFDKSETVGSWVKQQRADGRRLFPSEILERAGVIRREFREQQQAVRQAEPSTAGPGLTGGLVGEVATPRPGSAAAAIGAGPQQEVPFGPAREGSILGESASPEGAWDALKFGTRAAGVVAQTGYELMQGHFREVARQKSDYPFVVDPEGYVRRQWNATTVGQIAERWRDGKRIDMGDGFFVDPESPVGRRQAEAAREQFEIYGRALTPGRAAAALGVGIGIYSPDDAAYNIISGITDAAVALSPADPANVLFDGYVAGRRARRLFAGRGSLLDDAPDAERAVTVGKVDELGESVRRLGGTDEDVLAARQAMLEQAGAIREPRRVFSPVSFRTWLYERDGRKVTKFLAENRNIEHAFWTTGGDLDLAIRTVDARSEREVAEILEAAVGTTLLGPPRRPGRVVRSTDNVRVFHDMPQGMFDPNDRAEAFRQTNLMMVNANMPEAKRLRLAEGYARAQGRPARFEAIEKIYDGIGEELVERGLDPARAKDMTRFALKRSLKEREWMVGQNGRSVIPDHINVDGRNIKVPVRYVDHLSRAIPTLDSRDIRRLTSDVHVPGAQSASLAALYRASGKGVTVPLRALDWGYSKLFKPAVLVTRLAYPIRVIGEEQLRIAGAGMDSTFRHPISYVGWLIGRKGTLTEDDINQAALMNPENFEAWLGAQSRRSGFQRIIDDPSDPSRVIRALNRTIYEPGESRFMQSWAEELFKDHTDPIIRYQARHGTEATKEAFRDGKLAGFRRALADQDGWEVLDGPELEWADRYIDTLADHVAMITGGDEELVQVIATGKFGGRSIVAKAKRRGRIIDKEFRAALGERIDNAPAYVPGDAAAVGRREDSIAYNDFLDRLFDGMMGAPTDTLSRSPVWRQSYWTHITDNIQHLSPEDRTAVIHRAETVGISPRLIRRMKQTTARGDLTYGTMDDIAKAHALDYTKKLLYDLSKRNQFFDIARLIFPFGEAWKEIITTWARLITENPKILYRAQQTFTAAREAEGEGIPRGGWFHEDSFGREVFTFPASEWIMENVRVPDAVPIVGGFGGLPIEFSGAVSGLSLATEIHPGIGPYGQIPAKWLVPETSEWEVFREFIFPKGEPSGTGIDDLLLETVLPAWVKKGLAAQGGGGEEGAELRWKVTSEVSRMLYSQDPGMYQSEEGILRLLDEARHKATGVLIGLAIFQNWAPTTPIPEYQVAGRDGKLIFTHMLAKHFYEKQNEVGYDKAISWLIRTHGEGVLPAISGLTDSLIIGLEYSQEADRWERDNQGFVQAHPTVFPLFGPRSDEFSGEVYGRRIDRDQRFVLDPEVVIRQAHDVYGRYLYEKERKFVGDDPSPRGVKYLRRVRKFLRETYPGFESNYKELGKKSPEETLDEVRRASRSKSVRDTDAAKAAREYFKERDLVEAEALKLTDEGIVNWQTAKATRYLVRYLKDVQKFLRGEYPGARDLFDLVFSRDIDGLEEEE
jgi:hypothetical protein